MKNLVMNKEEDNNAFTGMKLLKKIGVILLVTLLITFYVMSLHFLFK